MNNHLRIIGKWTIKWKMSFNPNPTNHPFLFFNGNRLVQIDIQKHLGMLLDTKLSLFDHFKSVFEKRNKKVGLLCKLGLVLARSSLLII